MNVLVYVDGDMREERGKKMEEKNRWSNVIREERGGEINN